MKAPRLYLCAMLLAVGAAELRAQAPRQRMEIVDFGAIKIDADWERTLTFRNDGAEPLEIRDVKMTPPLLVTKMSARVAPGESGAVTVCLEKPRRKGRFQGNVVIAFKNDRPPLVFSIQGDLVPPVDFDPFPAFYLSTQRGEPKSAAIEIINHEPEPFEILRAEHGSSRFTTEVETMEKGKRYRLLLKMTGDGLTGAMADTITVITTSRQHPFLEVRANTKLNERVYTFPDSLDFGAISTQAIKARPSSADEFTASVMVYQKGGKDFRISADTDVPFLRVSTLQAHLKDRYEIRLTLLPEKLQAGQVSGTLLVATNDEAFPRLSVPIHARVE